MWHELAFGLESLGFDNATIKRRVAEMASYFNIQTWFRKDVSQLSGGQKQLMNLASIMAMQPQVLVLDEPTSQLDPIAASEFLRTVQKINRDLGTTVIISEHRLEEVFTMADKVMVMDKGKVLAYDEPRKIGSMLAGSGDDDRHPMFYGLPAMMKIYQSADGGDSSPLTIREGRLWIDRKVGDTYREGVPDQDMADQGDDKKTAAAASEPAFTVKDLWFRYNKKSQDVLRDLNISVNKGQLFCVLGGNGVGKSTTLKVIAGILKQQRGKVTVNGTLAMLPQNPQALFTEISVEDELMDITPHEHDQIRKYLGLSDEGKLMVDITLDAVHDREKRLERKSHL